MTEEKYNARREALIAKIKGLLGQIDRWEKLATDPGESAVHAMYKGRIETAKREIAKLEEQKELLDLRWMRIEEREANGTGSA